MENIILNPQFDLVQAEPLPSIEKSINIQPGSLLEHVRSLEKLNEQHSHEEILERLINEFGPVDFEAIVYPEIHGLRDEILGLEPDSQRAKQITKQLAACKLSAKHYLVLSIENVLNIAEGNAWGLCKNHDFIYLYNGSYWKNIDREAFQKFLGEAAEKMGVEQYSAKHYQFRDHLFKQFLSTAYLPTPSTDRDKVKINLRNGTFEITSEGTHLKAYDRSDFLTYQLPFDYDPCAKTPIFQAFLDRVLPDIKRQMILAEYLGFVFIKHGSNNLKEEKALILYGTGANGKSVFFEIVNALLGSENVCSYSLQSLTDNTGYFRAKLGNKLVNYASEINGKLETAVFKQLVSGEPVEARLPYGEPFTLTQYAKLIFNCNELPKDVEHTKAYFRRFMIVPFEETIPEHEQDKRLHHKIIEKELSGVFNWVLEGLKRLLDNKKFTDCDAVTAAQENYEMQSDSAKIFLEENGYEKSSDDHLSVKDLYHEYRGFCIEDGYKPLARNNFSKRLESYGIVFARKNIGRVAFLTKNVPF